jgi:hypothetical protein
MPYVFIIIQGYSKRSIHFQKFILQKLLMLNPCPMYRLKGNLSKFGFESPARCARNNSVCQGKLCSKWQQAHRRKLSACWNSPRHRQCQVCNIFVYVTERIRQPGSLSMTGTNSSKTKVVSARERASGNQPQRWIGRAANLHLPLLRWPPRSPDLTPCDFFLWGYVKGAVFVPPLPTYIDDLKRHITEVVAAVTCDML